MEPITTETIKAFLQRLGEKYPERASFYLLGGGALCLLGSPRQTMDIDYTTDLDSERQKLMEEILNRLADEHRIDVESVPIEEFIPLPPGADGRRQFMGRYGNLDVYVFDLYTIALSKIARGFDTDLDDVVFLIRENLINLPELQQHFTAILPHVAKADIIPTEFKQYYSDLLQRLKQ